MEETAAERSPVGELVANYLVRNKPAYKDTSQEAYNGI